MASDTRRVEFTNREGVQLDAQLELPKGKKPHAFALFAHCFTCNKNYKAPVFISRHLAEQGIATLRFDFPGLGGSSGDFADTTLTTNVSDVVDAARFLADEYSAPRALIGHSLGGAAVLLAAEDIPSAELVVTLAAPSRPGKLGHRLQKAKDQADREGIGVVEINGREFRLKKAFFEDLVNNSLDGHVANLDRKLLVVHAPDDQTVPFDSAQELMEWARLPKSLLKLEGGDHLITKPELAEQIANAIAVRVPK